MPGRDTKKLSTRNWISESPMSFILISFALCHNSNQWLLATGLWISFLVHLQVSERTWMLYCDNEVFQKAIYSSVAAKTQCNVIPQTLHRGTYFSSSLNLPYLGNIWRCYLKSMLAGIIECGENHICMVYVWKKLYICILNVKSL